MRRIISLCFAVILLALPAMALEAPRSAADIVLTVSGEITAQNSDEGAVFDRDMLRDVGWHEIDTFSPFLDGEHRFGGVPVSALLEVLGVTDGTMMAVALDDYSVKISVSELLEKEALLAMEHNGREMRVRNRGPLWLIWPLTEAEAAAGSGEGKLIWQLRSISFLP